MGACVSLPLWILLHFSHAHRFLRSDDQDTFFTCTNRHQIVSGGPHCSSHTLIRLQGA